MKIVKVLFAILISIHSKGIVANMEAPALSSAITTFSAKFCKELEKDKSVVSSPLSAEILLALLTLGTEEPAHSELITSLGIPDDDSIRSSFSVMSGKLKSIKGVTLNVANMVYVKEGPHNLQAHLEKDAVNVFNAGIEKLNFDEGPAACEHINKWVEGKTNAKIKDLLSPDSIDSNSRLVLVNALYFKGTWQKQFDPIHTRPQPFFITADNQVEVPMMYKEDNYRYGHSNELQAQLLEMAYVGGEASMLIVLPNEIDGLNDVLDKLAAGHDLLDDINKMHSVKVQVTIPKFKIESEMDLTQVLPQLGIKAIFNPQDSGLTKIMESSEPLYVSKAVQKAFIEVNEEGAEAAAATGIVIVLKRRVKRYIFCADKPFLYVLLGPEQTTMFIGMYRAP